MAQPKILPSSLRERKRYLGFEIISEDKIDFGEFVNAFWHSSLNFLGELGAAKVGVWLIKDLWDEKRQRGLIKCRHTQVENVRTTLALINRIGDTQVIARTLGLSGTMKTARKKFFGERDLRDFGPEGG